MSTPITYSHMPQNRPNLKLGDKIDNSILSVENWLVNAGMMVKTATPGFPAFLPAGQRVVNNLKHQIRNVADGIGFIEMGFPSIYPINLFEQSNRMPLFEGTVFISERGERGNYLCAPTHEEWVAQFFSNASNVGTINERNLPIRVYQISKLWRDLFGSGEKRSGKGLLKVNEFELFESYTLCVNNTQLSNVISEVDSLVYQELFKQLGLDNLYYFDHRIVHNGEVRDTKIYTDHLLPHPNGEYRFYVDFSGNAYDTPGLCDICNSPLEYQLQKGKESFKCKTESHLSDEPGRSYDTHERLRLQRMFTVAMSMKVKDECITPFNSNYVGKDGTYHSFVMGTHGMGIGRIIMSLYDKYHDKRGISWPKGIEPYQVTIIPRKKEFTDSTIEAWHILLDAGVTAVVDDRVGINSYPKVLYSEFIGVPFALQIGATGAQKDYSVVKRGARREEVYKTTAFTEAINFIKRNV